MALEWFLSDLWDDDDPDREEFEKLYWLESLGADVDAELDALRARREAEDVAFTGLTGVGRGTVQAPVTVKFPTEAEREEAYERAPIYSIDGRTGVMTQLRPRIR